jgi:hypothetical protein
MQKTRYKIKAENFLGATSELADIFMQEKYWQDYEDFIEYEDKEKTSSRYTDEGQEIFNSLLTEVENILHTYGIVHESEE